MSRKSGKNSRNDQFSETNPHRMSYQPFSTESLTKPQSTFVFLRKLRKLKKSVMGRVPAALEA